MYARAAQENLACSCCTGSAANFQQLSWIRTFTSCLVRVTLQKHARQSSSFGSSCIHYSFCSSLWLSGIHWSTLWPGHWGTRCTQLQMFSEDFGWILGAHGQPSSNASNGFTAFCVIHGTSALLIIRLLFVFIFCFQHRSLTQYAWSHWHHTTPFSRSKWEPTDGYTG